MAFRDSFDQCPRCAITLEDAQSARGCRNCGGVFIEEPVLAEMILQMLPPPPRLFGPLRLSAVKREAATLACPQCTEAMTPTEIHDVELDRCAKHGVWFDPDELRIMLYRVADPKRLPPFDAMMPTVQFVAKEPPPITIPKPPPPPQIVDPASPEIVFEVNGQEVRIQREVIKVGRLASAHLRLDDPSVSRMHAVIEATKDAIWIIDLGSTDGTFVNGKQVNKASLRAGDVIRCGKLEARVVAIHGA